MLVRAFWAEPPVMPPVTTGANQEYLVSAGTILETLGTLLAGIRLNAAPLQVVIIVSLITGTGSMIIVVILGFNAQYTVPSFL